MKAIRVYVESVLRFGLPVNFTAVVLNVKKNADKKLRSSLGGLYAHLAGARLSAMTAEDGMDYSGMGDSFFPYVFLRLVA